MSISKSALNSAFGRLESAGFVRPVAERTNGGSTAAAQRECFFALQIKHVPGGIRHGDLTSDQQWTVIFDKYFYF